MIYSTDLTLEQTLLIESSISDIKPKLSKHDFFDVLNAILYVAKTGCQWKMLPTYYPPATTVYHHFRSWSERGIIQRIKNILISGKRAYQGLNPEPSTAIIESESVRWGVYRGDKGFDGYKKVKGIKRHVAVDEIGLPISIHVTAADIHDVRAGRQLVDNMMVDWKEIDLIKADRGYCTLENRLMDFENPPRVECVKSNYGTSDFIPAQGRWVVERTFSWMCSCRRLMRNYERFLKTSEYMFTIACIVFLLKYFR